MALEGYSLRPATEDDLKAVLAVEHQGQPVAPWTETHFREELAKPYSRFLVLTDDETDTQVAAFIVFWILFEEAQVLDVVVALQHRGLGIGQMLLRQAVDEAVKKELQRVTLEVRRSNLPAIQLYQKLGFTIRNVRKAFYSNGEDAYGMQLELGKNADGVKVLDF